MLSIEDVYLKDSQITDQGVKYMLNFINLKSLFLRKNRYLTHHSIQYFNQMKNLEELNLTRTQITLNDLCEYLDSQSLREIFIDSDENEDEVSERARILKSKISNCKVYLNCSDPTDVFDVPTKPIF